MRGRLVRTLAVVGLSSISVFAIAQTSQPEAAGQSQNDSKDTHVFVLGSTDDKGKPVAIESAQPVPVTQVALPDKKLDHRTKLELIRALNAEIGYARQPLPKLEKGLVLPANGNLEPGAEMLNQLALQYGLAAKKGERVQITDMEIGDRSIKFILNGGAKSKHKWYEHVSVGVGAGEIAPMAKPDNPNAKGTTLTLTFPKFVPDVSAEQVRELLSPVIDFTVKSPMQAYADTLPPQIKKAVLEHEALVGMNHEMVLAALGRPDKKFRDDNGAGEDVEDWMYGKPPATVKFLRFKGDQLVRIKELPVGEAAVVRDKPEIDEAELSTFQRERREAIAERKAAREAASRPAPSLRREGDPDPVIPTQSDTVTVRQHPGQTMPPGTTPPTIDGTSGPTSAPTSAPPSAPGTAGDAPSGPR